MPTSLYTAGLLPEPLLGRLFTSPSRCSLSLVGQCAHGPSCLLRLRWLLSLVPSRLLLFLTHSAAGLRDDLLNRQLLTSLCSRFYADFTRLNTTIIRTVRHSFASLFALPPLRIEFSPSSTSLLSLYDHQTASELSEYVKDRLESKASHNLRPFPVLEAS